MRLARSIIPLVVCAVSTLHAAGADKTSTDAGGPRGVLKLSVIATVKPHSRSEKLRDVCRAGFEVNGCTDFPVEKLECSCKARDGAWVIDGSATVAAVIHVSNEHPIGTILIHERAHIGDLEAGLRAHLDTIGSRTFGSQKACETYAKVLTESPHLRVVMNELRKASNVKFGCDRKGRF
jgi:hypothetical protein